MKADSTDNLESVSLESPLPRIQQDQSVPYMVVLAGEMVGRVVRLKLEASMRAGRVRACEIYFNCSNISREHACFKVDEKGQTTLVDLNSTNGTLVNGKRISERVLRDGDRISMGNVILRYSLKDNLEFDLQQDLYHKATRDPLTGAFNKRYFMEVFQKEFSYHRRHDKPLSLVMIDLDDFKRLNDTYGHLNGDIVLKSLSSEVIACLREEDIFARFGGEEFVAIFRYTPRENAIAVASKLLEMIQGMLFTSKSLEFTVSATIGVATLEGSNFESVEQMLMQADQNLYIGKNQGKNQVIG